MSVHTPGPWKAEDHGAGHWEVSFGNEQGVIVKLDRSADGSPPYVARCEADARLIAAAPDLADACRALLNRWSNTREGSPHRVINDEDAAVLRLALVKAGR